MAKARIRLSVKNAVWITLLAAVLLVVGINLFARASLPDDPREQIERLREADLYYRAEAIYERLLAEAPLDLDLNYDYIQNHFDIESDSASSRDDEAIWQRYVGLTAQAGAEDVGLYCLGLLRSLDGDYSGALQHYEQVQNRDQKYLNNSIGYVLVRLGREDEAERHFRREIALDGNVGGAVSNLSRLYVNRGAMEDLKALADDERTARYMSLGTLRWLALRSGDALPYLRLTFVLPLRNIRVDAALVSLFICAMWFIFLWRIDLFEQEPLPVALAALALGALSAPFSSILSDLLEIVLPMQLNGGLLNDLVYSILHIGLIEEIAKFIPALLIVHGTRQVNEPLDMVVYGALAALGFATLENSLYFTGYGLGIVFVRFLISTVLHMSLTAYICYAWAKARYIAPRTAAGPVLMALVFATVAHGLFDYFLIGPLEGVSIFSILILAFMAMALGRMITNTLNFSPHFSPNLSASGRLRNYGLLVATSVALVSIAYVYDNFRLSTELANLKLLQTAMSTWVSAAIVFGALGEIGLKEGSLASLWKSKGG